MSSLIVENITKLYRCLTYLGLSTISPYQYVVKKAEILRIPQLTMT